MKKIEVKSGEYKICNVTNELVLYTNILDAEIACSFFSMKLRKVALARNVSELQIKQLIQEFNSENTIESGLIKIRITGGNESEQSKKNLDKLIKILRSIDNNSHTIDIVACDALHKFHPNSFELNCYHGHINTI